jgi:hypothetical protein
MLSDEEALTPAEQCYHRLLTVGLNEASELVDAYVKANSLTALYDAVLIPVITAAETDHQRGSLDNEQRDFVEQDIRDIIEDLGPGRLRIQLLRTKGRPAFAAAPAPACRVCCLPARADRDEIAGPCSCTCFSSKASRRKRTGETSGRELVKWSMKLTGSLASRRCALHGHPRHILRETARTTSQSEDRQGLGALPKTSSRRPSACAIPGRVKSSPPSPTPRAIGRARAPADKDRGFRPRRLKLLDSDTESVPESQFFKSQTELPDPTALHSSTAPWQRCPRASIRRAVRKRGVQVGKPERLFGRGCTHFSNQTLNVRIKGH